MYALKTFGTVASLVFSLSSTALADGKKAIFPVAVRYWGGPMVTIETWWHAPIAFDPTEDVVSRQSDFDVKFFFDTRGAIDDALRKRLADKSWKAGPDDSHYYGHHVSVSSKPPLALRLDVDGLTIVHWKDFGEATHNDTRTGSDPIDLLIVPIDDPAAPTIAAALKTIGVLKPRFVLPAGAPSSSRAEAVEAVAAFTKMCRKQLPILSVKHNTYAIGPNVNSEPASSTVLSLAADPWKPSAELAGLLDKMDAASHASQKVFAPLSVKQMNFRPSNGTHTPRWNVEHMLGRKLLFFSQIYTAQRPEAFRPIDLNPAQMPPDYQAAHPEWNGAAETGQMQRANALVRRFAYLLDGLPLDEPAPGSRWTPRGLLKQMERHYGEHTANVQKKFDLPDWPQE